MKTKFICPDNREVSIKDCLEKCRFKTRCVSVPTLKLCAEEREWKGKPSCTQLLNGTREAYLKITKNYAESIDKQMFKILGTVAHNALDDGSKESEARLELWGITGITDRIDNQMNSDGTHTLIDYKTCGSFKVKKALGIIKKKLGILKDTFGKPVLYKRGINKGKPKQQEEWLRDEDSVDMREWELQLNFYRIAWEKKTGKKIKDMYIEAIIRDGGCKAAAITGVDRNVYLIPVKKLEDKEVYLFFTRKRDLLLGYLESSSLPQLCSDTECWEGRKCLDYCTVWKHCKNNPYLQEKIKETNEMEIKK